MGAIVTVMGCDALAQVDALFLTVTVAVYVPTTAVPGIVIEIGVAAKAALTTSTNP